jgi:ABC-type branched-subunit amino acid transport system ATPase component
MATAEVSGAPTAGPGDRSVLRAEEVSVSFGGVRAVDSVSLHVDPGEIVGLVGPNGSGKSTMLNALTGMVHATGTVSVDGRPMARVRPGAMRRAGLLRTFQTPQVFPELTALENVLLSHPDTAQSRLLATWITRPGLLGHERRRWADAADALERVGQLAVADTPAGELSYGQQRLVEVARVICGRPRIVLLDEPGAGLNRSETNDFAELLAGLRAEGVPLLVVDHKIDFLDRLCDRLVVLQLGRVVADGPPATVWNDPTVVDAYLGRRSGAGGH